MTKISKSDFEQDGMNWLTANRDRISAKTTNRRLTSLRMFARWARWKCDDLNSYVAPVPLRGQPHPIPEGMDGVRRMIRHAKRDDYRSLIALMGMAGLRIAEALSVRPSHFDLETRMLTVYGKGKKYRVVPISDECWDVIFPQIMRAYVTGEDAKIVGLKDRNARNVITRISIIAGLQRRVASHDLRATFATSLYNATLDQRLVQEILGHASLDQISVYVGVAQDSMKKAVNKL